jgi:hypothetical protein
MDVNDRSSLPGLRRLGPSAKLPPDESPVRAILVIPWST